MINYLIILTITATSLTRLLPYLLTGIPYHTDTYALLPLMELLKHRTPIELTPEAGFDKYNIYWPGVITYAVVHSEVTGLRPSDLTVIAVPVVNSLSVLILTVFLRVLGMPKKPSIIASLIYGLAGSEAVIGAGVTKEGYAFTLLLFTLALSAYTIFKGCNRSAFLTLITYVTLTFTHHLTSVVAALLIYYLLISYLAGDVLMMRLLKASALVATNVLILATYVFVYSGRALPTLTLFSESDMISLFAYKLVTPLPIWLSLITRKPLIKLIKLWFVSIYVLTASLAVLSTRVSLVFGAPTVSDYELLLFTPYLLHSLIAITFVGKILSHIHLSFFTYLTLLGLLGVEYYLIFGSPALISEAYRLSTFIYLGISVLAAYSFYVVKVKKLKILLSTVLLFTSLACIYVVPYTALHSGYVGGSQRIYHYSDLITADYVSAYGGSSNVFCGDLRLSYLLYLRKEVDVYGGLKYLTRMSGLNCYLVVNELFRDVGYVAFDYGIPVYLGDDTFVNNQKIYVGGRNAIVAPKSIVGGR
ncbi:MAG: hypothetical protein N3G48_07360 [Sulfolobales archaeon]|nr:hypothetical protein [Sulfolobales archaeon]MCX8186904.1 hypothetical protein [Sulfolobales archaeon]